MSLEQQLDLIINAFKDPIVVSNNQAKISKLLGKEMDEKEEAMTLEELFLQQLQRVKKK